jgi:lysozyme family protein
MAKKANISPLIIRNEQRWRAMEVNPGRVAVIDRAARRLIAPAAKARYQEIERDTGVPWWNIAVIHERESSQRWDRSIAQGDPWNRVSTHVPKGRGPFASFRAAANDALKSCAPYAARWKDWTAGGTLTLHECYNGLGYFYKGRPSPYVFAGTNQYVRGKYVADGQYDPNVVDPQNGVAALLRRMQELDPSIKFQKDGKKTEGSSSVTTGGGAAAEAARQTSDKVDPSHADAAKELVTGGMPLGRVLLIIGVAIGVAVATYFVVRWIKRNRPRLVVVPEVTSAPGQDRVEEEAKP